MKKKIYALMLGLSLCLAFPVEAGAESFGTPENEDAVVVQMNSDEENAFSTGEPDEQPNEPIIQDAESQIQAFSSEQSDDASVVPSVSEQVEVSEGNICVKAEEWIYTNNGFRLRKETGINSEESVDTTENEEFPDETKVSEDTYYTAEDGLLQISTEYKGKVHTGYYLFDENGYMVTGETQVQESAVYPSATAGQNTDIQNASVSSFFTTEKEASIYAGNEGEALAPYNSDLGQQKRNEWVWDGTIFQYYDENGAYVTVRQLNQQYKNLGIYTGYFKIDNDYYCLYAEGNSHGKKDGTPFVGDIKLTAGNKTNLYYFQPSSGKNDIPGKMFHEGWRCIIKNGNEKWLYYNQGITNPEDIGKYYQRGITATTLDKKVKGNYTYLLSPGGYIFKNTMRKAENGAYYCTNKNGIIYRNRLVRYKGSRYYFGANGKRAAWKNRWAKCIGANDHFYYFGNTPGKVSERKGWQKLVNTKGSFCGWLYFNSRGNHYANVLTSADYYFLPDGRLAGGLQKINGKWYMFQTSSSSVRRGKMYRNAIVRYKNQRYMASPSGVLVKNGWVQFEDNWYYLKNYKIVTKCFIKKNGVNGYLDEQGRFTTGWVVVSNAQNLVRCIDPDGKGYAPDGFVRNTSKVIDGVRYHFDSNGYRITDLTNRYFGPYYLEVDKTNGVVTVYTDSSKTIPVKTIRASVGLPGSPTPDGTYKLRSECRWQPLMGPSWGQYGTHVLGAGQGGIYFHSIACGSPNSYNLPAGQYNKLGSPASHGCIRVCVADAKWIFENCNGATVHITSHPYVNEDVFKGPLGKKPLTPLRGAGNFDPTDPEV